MAFYSNPKIVTDGLTLLLDAGSENSYPGSGTTWTDLSGNGYDATLSAEAIGTVSASLDTMAFNSTDQYIIDDAASSELNVDYFTVEMDLLPIVDSYAGGPGGRVIWSTHTSTANRWIFFVVPDTGQIAHISTGTITTNDVAGTLGTTWKKVHFIRNGTTTFDIYMNGVYNASGTLPDYADNNQFSIGQEWDSATPSDFYYGQIAGIKIYNKALTQTEITQNFNAQRNRFGI
jgi:hypothetical protein